MDSQRLNSVSLFGGCVRQAWAYSYPLRQGCWWLAQDLVSSITSRLVLNTDITVSYLSLLEVAQKRIRAQESADAVTWGSGLT